MQEVFQYYMAYRQSNDGKKYTPLQAYGKVVRRWPDAMFDAYTFQKVICRGQYQLLASH